MSNKKFVYQDICDEWDIYLEKIATKRIPQNEEEELLTMEFLVAPMYDMYFLTCTRRSNYCNTSDLKEMSKHPFLPTLENLVSMVCINRNLVHPCQEKIKEKECGFIQWYKERAKKYSGNIECYSKLFKELQKTDDPIYPIWKPGE